MIVHPKITLEQWAAFKAVVDEGSFAAAAAALNKSQSSVSYLVSRLNDLLPAPAMTIEGRKAVQTDIGRTLYRHATTLLEQALDCENTARFLASGWESQLRLTCDALTPMDPVMCALKAFSDKVPHTRIKILETTLSGTVEAILNHECDLAIVPNAPPGFLATALTQISLVAVAHRDHPLSAVSEITEAELKTYRQIVLRDNGTKREQDAGWLGSEQRWTVSHFATSLDMIRSGLGFAFLPDHRIGKLIEAGELKPLSLELGSERIVALNLLRTNTSQPGPAAKLLFNKLLQAFQKTI